MIKNFISNGLIKWTLIVLIALSSVYIFWPFLVALILAGIFAAVLSPYYESFIKKFKLKRGTGALSLLTLFVIFAVIPFWAFVFRGVKLTLRFMNENFPQFKISDVNSIESQFHTEALHDSLIQFMDILGIDQESFKELINTGALKAGQFLFGLLQEFLTQLPAISIFIVVILMATYFALVDTLKIKKFFHMYSGLTDSQSQRLIRTLQGSSQAILLANIITGFVQALIVTLGAIFTGVGDGWIVFFVTFVASFIPVGAAPVSIVLALVAFSTDRFTGGVALLIVGAITGVVDNILRPFLIKGEGELHPFIAFLAVIGGVVGFGLPGLFIGPLVAALLIHCMPILIESDK